ncbi:short subunit dehydrogenase [Kribbella sp. VKM Ac-2527]|uniref:Short subunit dehydrogenase n=1 Tax=Kribbella caucasensis TaxID=2512215 RepID=A0A4R6K817_9ACTN|nr:SDR family NAD(P)-dependent oxidoreductase [Kribbella sp. VKM Ac-2527]TDO45679.1 short subunit dehydrogenase [Kribbella sp. VKM Ac-2527]
MKNVFVAGGTTGMGRAIAMHYLERGARVTVVGSTPARGERFLADAAALAARDRAAFVSADLLSVAENHRVVEEIEARHDALDAVVFTAMLPFIKRHETVDGFEGSFVLYYLSRFILSYRLTGLLERGDTPIITSIGATGLTKGAVNWDDLQFTRNYGVVRATISSGRANDLLGVHYVANHPDGRTKYLQLRPPYTNSGTNHLPQPYRALSRLLATLFAKSPEESVRGTLALMDDQPTDRLILRALDKPVDPNLPTFDPTNAQRLYDLTKHVLTPLTETPLGQVPASAGRRDPTLGTRQA